MKKLLIKGGRLIDPANGIDGIYNVYVTAGRVQSITETTSDDTDLSATPGLTVIEAGGLLVVPGLVDIHTHLREPGFEYKETVASGALAAAAGGFTTILTMANTWPVNDNQSVTRYILRKAAEAALVKVLPIGAVSMGLRGKELTEMAELKDAGCLAFSDDGISISDAAFMRLAFEYAGPLGLPLITHSEDPALSSCGTMNEGAVSTMLGLGGIPAAAEDVVVARDIELAKLTGGRLHVAHVSTAGTVALIREAKKDGVKITAEVTPHHLMFTDEALLGYDTNFKMSPPLRTAEDVSAVREGLKDGAIDCVATDHAPHSTIEKDIEWSAAANGVIGLETAFSVLYGLVTEGVFTLNQAIASLTVNPASVIGLEAGKLNVGAAADITLIDLDAEWKVGADTLRSRSKNSSFLGQTMKARVLKTIVDGVVVYKV
ncbi:MAG: dihydroorotase [Thermodesulfobacteriota bacterium]